MYNIVNGHTQRCLTTTTGLSSSKKEVVVLSSSPLSRGETIDLRGGLLAASLENRETRLTVVVMNDMLLKINERQARRSLRITKSSMKALPLHLTRGLPRVPANGGRVAVKLHFAFATAGEETRMKEG